MIICVTGCGRLRWRLRSTCQRRPQPPPMRPRNPRAGCQMLPLTRASARRWRRPRSWIILSGWMAPANGTSARPPLLRARPASSRLPTRRKQSRRTPNRKTVTSASNRARSHTRCTFTYRSHLLTIHQHSHTRMHSHSDTSSGKFHSGHLWWGQECRGHGESVSASTWNVPVKCTTPP